MAEIKRTGQVTYLAGYRQDACTPGQMPVYQDARVVEYDNEHTVYFPLTAAAHTVDGGITLPAELADKVTWK